MGKNLQNEVEYYYDSHPTAEDLMGETSIHARLNRYLMLVLEALFRGQQVALHENLNFYYTANDKEEPLVPDIAVIRGVDYEDLRSWKIGLTGPAPQVVFEIASEETWQKDVQDKPFLYAKIGVAEYFFYDPDVSVGRRRQQLRGWRVNRAIEQMEELAADEQGRLWSEQLESFLVPDGKYLRLSDRWGQRRLTGEEVAAEQAKVATQQAKVATQRAEAAIQQAEALAREKEAMAQRAAALAQEREALIQKLRSLGVNPDEL